MICSRHVTSSTENILRKECPNDSKFGPILCRNELAIQWRSLIWRNAHCQFYKNPQVLGGHKTEEEKSTKESDERMTSYHVFQLGRVACGWVQLLKCKSCTWISPFFQNSFSYCMCSFMYFQLTVSDFAMEDQICRNL